MDLKVMQFQLIRSVPEDPGAGTLTKFEQPAQNLAAEPTRSKTMQT
jgi:hypothetical protein